MSGKLAMLAALATGLVACGEPHYQNPSALQVVYLPLEGARDVPVEGLQPRMYFSDELDENTISDKTVFLKQSLWSCSAECSCGKEWVTVLGTLLVRGKTLAFTPATEVNIRKSCLVMAATTSLKGKNTAPLASLGLPAEQARSFGLEGLDIGAWQRFWTAE